MKRHSFIFGAFILAIGGILAKIVGAFYKIPLTNMLGTNGMGLYYLVFPMYSLILVLVSSGVSVGVSKLVAEERGKNICRKNELKILHAALLYVTVLGMFFGGLICVLSKTVSNIQGNVNAWLGYIAIAPGIVFASIISVFRAYFQGQENMLPTSVSNIFEQIIKLVSGLLLTNLFLPYGIIYGVCGAVLGVTISEFAALIQIWINYVWFKKKNEHVFNEYNNESKEEMTFKQAFVKLIKYSLPATLSSLILPITGLLDSFMIINILVKSGFSNTASTSLYGISNGIVSNLVSLPVVVITSLATAILPNISRLYSENNMKEITFRCSLYVKLTWLIALPCFVIFMVLAPDIISVLYKNGLNDLVINEFTYSYKLLMISSVSIIYYAFVQAFTSMLQSINKPMLPVVSFSIALVVRVLFVWILVSRPGINIFGQILANTIFLLVATLLNLVFVRKYILLDFSVQRTFVSPVFCAAVMGCLTYITRLWLANTSPWLSLGVSAAVGGMAYLGLVVVLQCFSPAEAENFPFMKKLFRKKRKEK